MRAGLAQAAAAVAWLLCVLPTVPAPVQAQGLTGSLDTLTVDTDEPIRIEADLLEVDEKASLAVFSGRVTATQERMRMTTEKLEIRYRAGEGEQAQIRTIDARGSVVMTVDDQVVRGSHAHYDLATETLTLAGGVVLSQGENVIRGDRLEVNLRTGRSRIVSLAESENRGRVRGLFRPNRQAQ